MRRRVSAALVAMLGCLTVGGCTNTAPTTAGAGPDESSSAPSSVPAIRAVAKDEAALHLWVSNQSFDDDTVALTISIDGVPMVDRSFSVGNQHNWILFPIDAPPGRHVLTAVSDSGAKMTKDFRLPEADRRYAVVDYWHDRGDKSPHFTWRIQKERVIFM